MECGSASRAAVLLATSNEALLGVVGNVGSENGINLAYKTIGTYNFDSFLSRFDQRLQNRAHAVMEYPIAFQRSALL